MNLPSHISLPSPSTILTAVTALLALGLGLWLWTKWGRTFRSFLAEVWVELGKCSWPWNPKEKGIKRYKELIDSTVVVAVSALLLAGIVTSSDFFLVKVIGFLTRLHI